MSIIRTIYFLLFVLFTSNLYSTEIYKATCSEPGGTSSVWSFDISLSEQNVAGLSIYEMGLNDESISFSNDYEGQKQFFEFYFEGPNAGLIFRDGSSLDGFSCEWDVVYASATSSESSFDSSKPHVIVELISYEDKLDYEDKPVCEIEFTVTNNSFGTMYDYRISTETFDDRGDKMDEYAMDDKIDAFGDFWSFDEDIKLENSATSKSLQLKGKCSYIQDIYMTEVKNRYCNIRMLPDGFDCLSLVKPISKIDHINLQYK